jgi:hypothetical protein
MSQLRRSQRSVARLAASIVYKMFRLGCCYCELGVLRAIVYSAPCVPILLERVGILGAGLCLVAEFVIRYPGFPFWSAMQLPIACGVLLVLYRVVAAVLHPMSR